MLATVDHQRGAGDTPGLRHIADRLHDVFCLTALVPATLRVALLQCAGRSSTECRKESLDSG